MKTIGTLCDFQRAEEWRKNTRLLLKKQMLSKEYMWGFIMGCEE